MKKSYLLLKRSLIKIETNSRTQHFFIFLLSLKTFFPDNLQRFGVIANVWGETRNLHHLINEEENLLNAPQTSQARTSNAGNNQIAVVPTSAPLFQLPLTPILVMAIPPLPVLMEGDLVSIQEIDPANIEDHGGQDYGDHNPSIQL